MTNNLILYDTYDNNSDPIAGLPDFCADGFLSFIVHFESNIFLGRKSSILLNDKKRIYSATIDIVSKSANYPHQNTQQQ